MPIKVRELSATEVRRLTHSISKTTGKEYNGLHSVGGVAGLLLQVTPSGAKSWVYRTRIAGQRRSVGLGGFPDVTLAQARDKARVVRDKIAEGIDPIEERQAVRRELLAARLSTKTFADAMADYIGMKSTEWKNPRQAQQWTNSLTTYALPHIGKIPVRDIELGHIKAVLDPIWQTKTETANRVRSRMETILGWCATHDYRSNENPAKWKGYLDKVYPAPGKIKKRGHHAALAVDAIPEFMTDLQKRTGTAARALEFLILTAARTNEVIGDKRIGKLGITWQEIDLKAKVWTVPAGRMKSGKQHKVPLTEAAVDLLKNMKPGAPDAMVFAGGNGAIPSNNFLSALLKRMDQPVTAHGFRSTFKDWARERTAYADEVSELALAHVNSDATRAAYARSGLIDKRRQLMQDWEQYCYHGKAQEAGEVVSIGGGAA
ncbi:phage integrase family protein [Alcanivorax sp. NBRC 101098]|jgi:integrase|uniref:tyrosine-type recombinase/integrase n=1 Tax=Alcanivorax sp. NBRC 101098 TaxID=1113728 RepID=UPI0004ABD76B|nr:site-specific integrase [Alcanivorax sp. NBRC 101098]BAP13783.1 phage integrase family protein [Alcanivorax sp. NBRC 101098]